MRPRQERLSARWSRPSRDPFATLEACGHGRIGRNRHCLAWNAIREGAGPLEFLPRLGFRQLSRGSPCRQPARRRRRGLLLPGRTARRPAQQRASRPHFPRRIGQWRGRRGGQARRARLQVDKNDRIARLVLGVRAIKQKQYAAARRELGQSVRGPITDLAATLLSAWTMGKPEPRPSLPIESIDKLSGPDWYAIFKDMHAGLILDICRPEERGGEAIRARVQARSDGAARSFRAYGSFLPVRATTMKP